MTSLFAHTPYAEDQPSSRPILTLHVLARGFLSGSVVSVFYTGLKSTLVATKILKPRVQLPLGARILAHSARGSLWGTAISGVMLAGRMWDKEEIEWQDRAWRLLENKPQMETDWWQIGGTAVGIGGAMRYGRVPVKGWERIVGGAGVGNTGALGGFMVSETLKYLNK